MSSGQNVVDAGAFLPRDAEADGRVALRVDIDHQGLVARGRDRAAATLTAVVVLPTPPLRFAIA